MDTRLKGKKGYMAIKLDMSKAYDRVEWQFLEEIIKRLSFADHWISLLMKCVRSVTYSGNPMGCISLSKGLRQGDSLSPYLFLLCAKGLCSMLSRAEGDGRITRVPISHRGTKLSHLFFTDDSLLFCHANFTEWCYVHKLLHNYELASGQNSTPTRPYFSGAILKENSGST